MGDLFTNNLPDYPAIGGALAPFAKPSIYNLTPANLRKWRKALANVALGAGSAKILFIGDSKTMGRGAGTTGAGQTGIVGARPKCKPIKFAQMLAAASGLPVNSDAISGMAGCSITELPTYDSRITIGSGIVAATVFACGGDLFKFNASGSGKLSVAFPNAVDTFRITYYRDTTNGTLSLAVDGGAEADTIVGAGAAGMVQKIFTVALGVHTLDMFWKSGGNGFVQTIEAYDSSKSLIHVINAGASGSNTSNWATATSVFQPGNQAITALAPDLSIINVLTNDRTGGIPIATTKTSLQTLITKCKASGDVILLNPTPRSVDSAQTISDYLQMLLDLAQTNGCILIDEAGRFIDFATANADGYYFDGTHENAPGYADLARALVDPVLS